MNKPSIKDCFEYCNNMEQSVAFYNHFESIDWLVGKKGNAKPMVNWKSALTNWVKRSKPKQSKMDIALSNKGQDVINMLWVRMSQIYGHKWTSSYGPEPTKPWVDVVVNLSNEKIAHGLSLIVKSGDDWPVSLVKFNHLCQSYQPKLKTLTHSLSREELLAQRTQTEHIRIKSMSEMRGIF